MQFQKDIAEFWELDSFVFVLVADWDGVSQRITTQFNIVYFLAFLKGRLEHRFHSFRLYLSCRILVD